MLMKHVDFIRNKNLLAVVLNKTLLKGINLHRTKTLIKAVSIIYNNQILRSSIDTKLTKQLFNKLKNIECTLAGASYYSKKYMIPIEMFEIAKSHNTRSSIHIDIKDKHIAFEYPNQYCNTELIKDMMHNGHFTPMYAMQYLHHSYIGTNPLLTFEFIQTYKLAYDWDQISSNTFKCAKYTYFHHNALE
jgi:hypothetical protein